MEPGGREVGHEPAPGGREFGHGEVQGGEKLEVVLDPGGARVGCAAVAHSRCSRLSGVEQRGGGGPRKKVRWIWGGLGGKKVGGWGEACIIHRLRSLPLAPL